MKMKRFSRESPLGIKSRVSDLKFESAEILDKEICNINIYEIQQPKFRTRPKIVRKVF